jgi:predicted transcriptional regulator YheO
MSKEQENLRQQFIDETKAKLWAEDINEDVGFSDKYVEWLEAKQLILSGVSHQRELLKKLNETGVFKNTEDQIEMILKIVNY